MKLGNIAQEESSIGVTTDQGLQRFCGLQLELLTLQQIYIRTDQLRFVYVILPAYF